MSERTLHRVATVTYEPDSIYGLSFVVKLTSANTSHLMRFTRDEMIAICNQFKPLYEKTTNKNPS